MAKLIMLVGLQGSGKSTMTKDVESKKNVVILSSDNIRERMFGSRVQDKNDLVFNYMNNETRKYLKRGINVVYDATNVNSRRRKALLNQLPKDIEKICIYLMTDKETCIYRDANRVHSVGKEVIERTYKNLQIPMYHEGWDDIILFLPTPKLYPRKLSDWLKEKPSLFNMLNIMEAVGINPVEYDVEQGSPHHTETILNHLYTTYKYIYDNYTGEHKKELLLASILHDIGKIECKEYNEEKGYYTYYNHEKVSAQIALQKLSSILPNEESIMIATIIALHGRLSYNKDKKADAKLIKLVGDELYSLLEVFRIADKQR